MAADLEPRLIDALLRRELAGLAAPVAPPTLLPRIMAAVHEWATRPWYRRAWFTWPVIWQAVALVLLSTFAAVAVFGAEAAQSMAVDALRGGNRFSRSLSVIRAGLMATTTVTRALLEPAIVYRAYAFAFVVAMCAACAGLAAVLQLISLERTRVP